RAVPPGGGSLRPVVRPRRRRSRRVHVVHEPLDVHGLADDEPWWSVRRLRHLLGGLLAQLGRTGVVSQRRAALGRPFAFRRRHYAPCHTRSVALLLILVALLFGVGFGSGSVTSHATGSGRAVPYRAHATLPARHD